MYYSWLLKWPSAASVWIGWQKGSMTRKPMVSVDERSPHQWPVAESGALCDSALIYCITYPGQKSYVRIASQVLKPVVSLDHNGVTVLPIPLTQYFSWYTQAHCCGSTGRCMSQNLKSSGASGSVSAPDGGKGGELIAMLGCDAVWGPGFVAWKMNSHGSEFNGSKIFCKSTGIFYDPIVFSPHIFCLNATWYGKCRAPLFMVIPM